MANLQLLNVAERHVALHPAATFGKAQNGTDDGAHAPGHGHDALAAQLSDDRSGDVPA
jgi:hypothetical protein